MLNPPTNLPKPTAENLGLYKPKKWLAAAILVASVTWIIVSYLEFGVTKVLKQQFLFWTNAGLAACFTYLSYQMEGLTNLVKYIRYYSGPLAYAQNTWAQQEAHRTAYEAEQQHLKTEVYWKGMSGFEFEANLYEVLTRQGIKAELTKKTGDGGVDIWVLSAKGRVAIQCKAYKKQAGPAAVRELYGVVHGSKAIMGILACTGGFTSGAIEFSNSNKGIYLADLRDIILMAKGESKLLPSLR